MKKSIIFFIMALFTMVCVSQNQKLVDIKQSQLPKAALDFMKQNLPGAPVIRAAKLDDKTGITYIAVTQIKDKTFAYQFDKEGKFLGKADHLLKAQTQGSGTKPATAGTTTDSKKPANPPSTPPVKAGETKSDPAGETPQK